MAGSLTGLPMIAPAAAEIDWHGPKRRIRVRSLQNARWLAEGRAKAGDRLVKRLLLELRYAWRIIRALDEALQEERNLSHRLRVRMK